MSADPKVVPLQKAPDLTPGDVAISEDRLALRFVEVHGQRYRYVPGWGRVDWTGTRWRRDVSLQHFDDVRLICRQWGDVGFKQGETRRIASAKIVAAVVQLARADRKIVAWPETFDADHMALNTPAGIIDLRDGAIRPHDRDYVTKCTAVAPTFDRPATTWLRFLADVFEGDDTIIAFVRRLLGCALTGETREQVVAFITATARTASPPCSTCSCARRAPTR